ncbi:MAG: hypothetical protein HJJLKODD_02820 [Phycisphaerae bacterium]|nr:hypothetical protein [Phycisphaerae bacterium]
MDRIFPTGFPLPTAFYLTVYMITLVIHVLFMNYVLAGSAFVAVSSLFRPKAIGPQLPGTINGVLRDWLPFALGMTITAGVAPLLFVQILYKKSYYTANLLLFHRWMSILPVLILGFYLLYLIKRIRFNQWSLGRRRLVVIGAFLCFGFTAYSWTENHLLSLESTTTWTDLYAREQMHYFHPVLIPRLLLWALGSVPTMLLGVAWQLWFYQRRIGPIQVRPLQISWLALVGIILSLICGGIYYGLVDDATRQQFTQPLTSTYLLLALVGLGLQFGGWALQAASTKLQQRWLILASIGLLITLLCMTVVRESARLVRIDITSLYEQHAQLYKTGGFFLFLAFFLLMVLVVAWIIFLIRRNLRVLAHHQP